MSVMLNLNDNYTAYDENAVFELALLSVIGDRKEQQDRIGYCFKESEGIVVVCDGMGGHEGGQIASTLAVKNLIDAYASNDTRQEPRNFFLDVVNSLDKYIAQLKKSDGTKMQAGSTLSAVMVQEQGLYWVSVGDSRIYICRNDELVCVTKDHTYKMILDAKRLNGDISDEVYEKELKKGNVLVSFLGVNGLPYIDSNFVPFTLLSEDIILIISDGISKILTNDEILTVLKTKPTIMEKVETLFSTAQHKALEKQKKDNISIAAIKIK